VTHTHTHNERPRPAHNRGLVRPSQRPRRPVPLVLVLRLKPRVVVAATARRAACSRRVSGPTHAPIVVGLQAAHRSCETRACAPCRTTTRPHSGTSRTPTTQLQRCYQGVRVPAQPNRQRWAPKARRERQDHSRSTRTQLPAGSARERACIDSGRTNGFLSSAHPSLQAHAPRTWAPP
jgi:hypothetical protein